MKPSALSAAAAAVLLLLGGGAALAQSASPVGDWQGVLSGGGGKARAAVHIEEVRPGVLAGDIDLPDSGLWNQPLKATFKDGVLTFSHRYDTRRFEGRWDEAAGAWLGRYTTAGGGTDLALKPGFLGMPVVEGLDGRWEGVMNTGAPTRVIVNIATTAHGTHTLIDLPHAMETNIPVSGLARQGEAVSFTAPALGMRFEGTLDPTTRALKGRFGAPGADYALELVRHEAGGPRRTQTPAAPFPYAVEEVILPHPTDAKVQLGCTLVIPKGGGRRPAALLLTGTGQQDRDEAIVFHKPFLILADHLARHGVASLRCDDRGVGGSTGDFKTASLEDFAVDAGVELAFLRSRPEIAPGKVGLIGHSEGGLVASMVGADRSDLAFVVLLAGPGVPIYELLLKQGEETSRAQGAPQALIAQQSALRRAIYDAARAAATPQAVRADVEALLVAKGLPQAAARAEAAQTARPDILRILTADPAPYLTKITAPVLALVGSKDTQVSPAQNVPALRAALAKNADAQVLELPGLNHMMQPAKTGAVAEYYEIEETVAPSALNAVTDWLKKRGLGS